MSNNKEKFAPSHQKQPSSNVPKLQGMRSATTSNAEPFSPIKSPNRVPTGVEGTPASIIGQKGKANAPIQVENTFPVPFLLSEKWKERSELILNWVRTEIQHYNCPPVTGTHSFGSGEHFLALTHKFYPQQIDFENFNRSHPEAILQRCLFILSTPPLSLPNLLSVTDIHRNSDPSSLLIYIHLLRQRVTTIRSHPSFKTFGIIQNLSQTVKHTSDSLDNKGTKLGDDIIALVVSSHKEAIQEEKKFLDQRGKVMDVTMREVLRELDQMEQKNLRLEESNSKLIEKVKEMEDLLQKEEAARKTVEQILKIEEELRSLGEVIDEKTVDDYLDMYLSVTNKQ